ncbi:hypothetical protein EJB05_06211, partial [Eragrostis curvula]
MDEYFNQSLLLSVVAVVLLQLLKLALRPKAPPTPPGPWSLPVIGSMHRLVNVLPHRALRDLAAVYGPVMMLRLGETPLVVASSKESARAVLKTHDTNFATRPKLLAGEIVDRVRVGRHPLLPLRRLLAQAPPAVRRRDPQPQARALVPSHQGGRGDAAGSGDPGRRAVDAGGPEREMFHSITNSIVARAAFGKERKNAAEFMSAIKAGVGLSSGFCIPDLFPTWTTLLAKVTGMRHSLEQIHGTVDCILEEIIDERKAVRDKKVGAGVENVDENLVDVLIGLQEKGGFGFHLDNSKIKAIILKNAGHVRGRDGDVGVGDGVGDVGADAQPSRDDTTRKCIFGDCPTYFMTAILRRSR